MDSVFLCFMSETGTMEKSASLREAPVNLPTTLQNDVRTPYLLQIDTLYKRHPIQL